MILGSSLAFAVEANSFGDQSDRILIAGKFDDDDYDRGRFRRVKHPKFRREFRRNSGFNRRFRRAGFLPRRAQRRIVRNREFFYDPSEDRYYRYDPRGRDFFVIDGRDFSSPDIFIKLGL